MIILYNLGIRIYYFLILLVSPFNPKDKKWISGRKSMFKYLDEKIKSVDKTIWFHVSSLGEFEQGRPIIESIKKQYPGHKIVLTFFSPSGYEIRKNYTGADAICYLPLDTRRNARKFLGIVKPELTFFVKYDFWFHHLREARKINSRLFLVSGIFREKQTFFKAYGGWYRKMLHWFEHFFVQNDNSLRLLESISIKHVTVTGDTRFDRVIEIAQNAQTIEPVEAFCDDKTTIVCGSTWPEDEEMLIKYIQEEENDLKLILAPHEINKTHIDKITKQIKVPYACFSQREESDLKNARVFIIDNIGMLSSIYRYGQIAYIGGGFGNGIHNTLEAAVYGTPVFFGPNYHKFQEAKDLINQNGGVSFGSYNELKTSLNNYLKNPEDLKKSGAAAGNYVMKNAGATATILNYLKKD